MGKLLKLQISNAKFLIILIAIVVFASIAFYFLSLSSHQTRIQSVQAQTSIACSQSQPCQCKGSDGNIKTFYRGFCCQGIWFDDKVYSQCPSGNFYCVDQNHPQANNANPGTEVLPWRDAWYGARQLYPGDTLYIKAGTYTRYPDETMQRYRPGIRPIRSGTATNPITIRAYPGNEAFGSGPYAVIRVDATLNAPQGGTWQPAIGATGVGQTATNYIIFDGLKVEAAFALWYVNNCIVRNCDITIGGDGEFGTTLRMEYADNCIIENNRFHDNIVAGSEPSNWMDTNCPLIQEYDSTDSIIQNNDFYNGVCQGVCLKDDPKNIHVRYNIFRDMQLGVLVSNQDDDNSTAHIYQNIFMNFNRDPDPGDSCAINLRCCMTQVNIYNNVFYNNRDDIASAYQMDDGAVNMWNNIFMDNSNWRYLWASGWEKPFLQIANYLNHNSYYIPGENVTRWYLRLALGGPYYSYNTLSQWRTITGKEQNSITTDPLFVDTNTFHLQSNSPAKGTGKDGLNMGAYATTQDEQCLIIGIEPEGYVCGQIQPPPAYLLPDLTKDKVISQLDFDQFKTLWGTIQGDFNSDSKTDSKDFGIMMSKWGSY